METTVVEGIVGGVVDMVGTEAAIVGVDIMAGEEDTTTIDTLITMGVIIIIFNIFKR